MPFLRPACRPAAVVLLALVLGAGPALPQALPPPVAPGSLPPPRPIQPPPAPAAAPAAPAATQAPRPASPAPQAQPPRPAAPPATQPAQAPRPAQPAPPRPQAQQPATQRPPGEAPAVGAQTPPQNRRPPAAAAGAAAGAAAAGGAAAASRTVEPAQPPGPPPGPPPLPPPSIGQVSNLPIPRFASLRADQVNLRVGPNTTFPIEWTFQRRDLPVMIVGEFQVWRRVRDAEGTEGWVHQSTLASRRRTALVQPAANAPEITLRRRPEDSAAAVARLRSGVIARIRECEPGSAWCEVQVATHRGYIRRADVWGLLPDEEVR